MRKLFLAAMLLALTGGVAIADEPVISIGDSLPAMKISHFLQGDEVSALDRNRVYILEFWATW
ncbi:MAG TPA: hypothetical protein EYN79_07475 [Planctomycetes bacterium]|nr:hypothetical protein [Planctomycetota bacterium]HIN80260.1 hypothetical protein [Planctomycetota bacterium]